MAQIKVRDGKVVNRDKLPGPMRDMSEDLLKELASTQRVFAPKRSGKMVNTTVAPASRARRWPY